LGYQRIGQLCDYSFGSTVELGWNRFAKWGYLGDLHCNFIPYRLARFRFQV